jgi:hypothetical protein
MNGPVDASIDAAGNYTYSDNGCVECSLYWDPLNQTLNPVNYSSATKFMVNYCGWRNLTTAYAWANTGLGRGQSNECGCMVSSKICPRLFDGNCTGPTTPTKFIGENMLNDDCEVLGGLDMICIQEANQTFFADGGASQTNNEAYIEQTQICENESKENIVDAGVDVVKEVENSNDTTTAAVEEQNITLIWVLLILVMIIIAVIAIYYLNRKNKSRYS